MGKALKAALIVAFMPIVQMTNLFAYACTRDGAAAKVGTFLVMLPVVALSTALWLCGWVVVFVVANAVWRSTISN